MEAAMINAVGLWMDVIGVWVLFLLGDFKYMFHYGDGDPSYWITRRARAVPFFNWVGITSITIGFLLQIAAACWVP